jgi:type IX secretion system PorP/SprF family membrane protein
MLYRVMCFLFGVICLMGYSQENTFTHYFAASADYNPAFAGATRFGQVQVINRLQPTSAQITVYNSSFSYDQKIRNQHSGLNINVNQKVSVFKELQVKLSYSYTANISRRSVIKGGAGISWNSVNTYANTYKFPDQYNTNGFTGNLTQEPSINAKANYPAFSGGIVLYSSSLWIAAGFDNINKPSRDFAGTKEHVAICTSVSAGYLFPLDKNTHSKRIFSQNGGFEPYSSLGPVVTYYCQGPFHNASIGISGFNKPVFWGASYRINAFQDQGLAGKVNALQVMAGFRNDVLSIAYSYDFVLNRSLTNYRGAHEISLVYYFYSIREDYKKHLPVPFPNQLMY